MEVSETISKQLGGKMMRDITNITTLDYHKYIVAFSGGKDSIACFLHLLDMGVPKERIELWHHDIDGEGPTYMDWECTKDYCQMFADAFGVKIYFQWKEGGFKRELLKQNDKTAPTHFELPDGTVGIAGGKNGKIGTRRKFPQVAADLRVRWCSAYLKIDVCAIAIRNQKRFEGIRTMVLSGERGEESANRAKYAQLELDRADNRRGIRNRRMVDRCRPIRDWTEFEVWEIIRRYQINPHPAYQLGWSRVSCKFCIFGGADQFKSGYVLSPKIGDEIINHEKEFQCSIKRNKYLPELIESGTAYDMDPEMMKIATSSKYNQPIIVENWKMPKGAFGDSCGPT